MKSRIAWSAVPLVLAALLFGLKWRTDHPTLAGLNAQIAQQLSDAPRAAVGLMPKYGDKRFKVVQFQLSKAEFQPFIGSLKLSSSIPVKETLPSGERGIVWITSVLKDSEKGNLKMIAGEISLDQEIALINVYKNKQGTRYQLDSAALGRWKKLLLKHPRIGPELRARLK